MKVYSPNDIATILNVKPATLRKYSSLLEKHGYNIERNSQGHRYYRDEDIITIRNVISGKNSGVSIEKSINNVVNLNNDITNRNDSYSAIKANDSEITSIKKMIENQSEMINQQNELIQHLTDRLDQQQKYIDKSLRERDENLKKSMDSFIEDQKQIEENQDKRGFWSKLFGKQS